MDTKLPLDSTKYSANQSHHRFYSPPTPIVQESEDDEQEPIWRGVFVVPHQHKVLFRKKMVIETDKLPQRKPNIIIDSNRLSEDDELSYGDR
jgi:hypothetical protein